MCIYIYIYTHTYIIYIYIYNLETLLHGSGLPGGSNGEDSDCNVGDLGLIPGLGRSPRKAHGNPWAGEPGGLQSVELQRVGHDRATHAASIWS